jgi:GT2 family glycosyltransferase
MSSFPKVPIIIASEDSREDFLRECVESLRSLDYPNFDVTIVTDFAEGYPWLPNDVRVLPAGKVSPAIKRNIGAQKASGDMLAFLDSDACVPADWLKRAVSYLEDEKTAAVGGPNLTPCNDTLPQRCSGYILESFLGTASMSRRYKFCKSHTTDNIPTCNFICRKNIFDEVGGFNERTKIGEDGELCTQFREKGFKLLLAGDVIIYHHRRKLILDHAKQMYTYGVSRGFLGRKNKAQRSLIYILPTMFIVGFPFLLIPEPTRILSLIALLSYSTLVSIVALSYTIKEHNSKVFFLMFSGMIVHHLAYGLGFIKGLIVRKL